MSRRLSSRASGFGAAGGSGETAVSIWSRSRRCHGCNKSAYFRGLRFGRRLLGFRGDAPPKTDRSESSPLSGWTVPNTEARESCGSKCDAPPSSAFSRLEPSLAVGVGGGFGVGGAGAGLEWAADQVAWAASSLSRQRLSCTLCVVQPVVLACMHAVSRRSLALLSVASNCS